MSKHVGAASPTAGKKSASPKAAASESAKKVPLKTGAKLVPKRHRAKDAVGLLTDALYLRKKICPRSLRRLHLRAGCPRAAKATFYPRVRTLIIDRLRHDIRGMVAFAQHRNVKSLNTETVTEYYKFTGRQLYGVPERATRAAKTA